MRRDLDLARRILQEMEVRSHLEAGHAVEIEGHNSEEINYHTMLLEDAELIAADDVSSQTALIWLPLHITWAGHEFLDVSRDERRWKKAKKIIEKKGGISTFELLNELLRELMRCDLFDDLESTQK